MIMERTEKLEKEKVRKQEVCSKMLTNLQKQILNILLPFGMSIMKNA